MMKHLLILPALLFAASGAHADENQLGREFYASVIQCAAFHAVEAGQVNNDTDSAASQLAVSNDYRMDARKHAPDGLAATADADIDQLVTHYRAVIRNGDPEEVAKDWTDLESACRELHMVKGRLAADAGSR